VDVFTATPLAGNGLPVVHDADDIADETMLRFAAETRQSETTFVQSGDDECDYRNRIWMITRELPMAGHPSLGTAVAVAARRGESTASYVQRTPSGLQPVDVTLDGRVAQASMVQEPERFLDELDPARVFATIGLTADDGVPDLPPQLVNTGANQILAPLRSTDALARARPNPEPLGALIAEHQALTVYAMVCDPANEHVDARAFFDVPGGMAAEDPATGSAAGPAMAYLRQRTGIERLVIDQGVQMLRPSRIEATMEGDRPRVGGSVVILAEGSIHL
jgi:trans-2,3-dihydro-3-hydroxyanthranilate isomerase